MTVGFVLPPEYHLRDECRHTAHFEAQLEALFLYDKQGTRRAANLV